MKRSPKKRHEHDWQAAHSTPGKPTTMLNWKPRRHGPTYCSPACGGSCTQAAFQAAKRRAALLAESLGPQWEPVIHENLGWYYSARLKGGHLSVSPHIGCAGRVVSYSAFLNRYPEGAGGHWRADAKSPRAAVRKVRAAVSAEIQALHALMIKIARREAKGT